MTFARATCVRYASRVLRFSALVCPHCGAPLPYEALMQVVVCRFCEATVAAEAGLVSAAAYRKLRADLDEEARASAEVSVAGVPYRVLGLLGRGESHDVFLGERTHRLRERVVLKVLRAIDDEPFHDQEWNALAALHASTVQGAPQMTRRLPQLVARGKATGLVREERPALVLRAMSGFVHTFDDVRAAYPQGVDARHAVWMWRRILELLAWVHANGFVHGAILPQHLLVHARDHGVMLVGWSCAARLGSGAPLPHSKAHRAFYPPTSLIDTRTDLAMSARTILFVIGGDPTTVTVPGAVPAPIAELVRGVASGATHDARLVHDALVDAARRAYGPPRYVHLHLPGWPA